MRCFHYNSVLKLLVTGCSHTVYIWNPLITKMYLAKLEGHQKSVVDVRIFEHFNFVISISKDEVKLFAQYLKSTYTLPLHRFFIIVTQILKVWSLNTYVCLQTVQFDFPVYNVLGKSVEFSPRTFYPGPVTKQPPEEQHASLKSIDASNITSVPTSVYMPK